jgi:hypothetical protein
MAVAVQPQRAVRGRLGESLLDDRERIVHHGRVGRLDVRRDPPRLEQEVRGLAPHPAPVEPRTVAERPRAAHRVDARQEAPHPLAILARRKLWPVTALATVQRVAKAADLEQRAARVHLGCDDRDLGLRELQRKLVLLEDGGRAPAAGAVELGDHRRPVVAAHLVDTVFIAVQRKDAAIRHVAERFDRLDDEVGRERGIRMRGRLGHGRRIVSQNAAGRRPDRRGGAPASAPACR